MTNASMAALINREVSAEELHHVLHDALPADERDEIHALHRWFVSRYPTGEARLAYARRAHARWTQAAAAGMQPRSGRA